MILKRIRIRNFRNYKEYTASFSPGINLIVGGNGVGKTNLLEAVFMTLEGKTLRAVDMAETIREGEAEAVIEADYGNRLESSSMVRILSEGDTKKELVKGLRGVAFIPEYLELIKGGPEWRRRYLDETLVGLKPAYKETLREYARVLKQRNEAIRMVRKGIADTENIRFWNELLLRKGMEIVEERGEVLRRIERVLDEESRLWGWRSMKVGYFTSMITGEDSWERNRNKLGKIEEAEIRRGTTLMGPHRDEIVIYADGRNLRRIASQGEQKMASMLCVFAKGKMYREEGKEVILLLDDCFTELDGKNRRRLGEYIRGWDQVLATSTDEVEEVKADRLIMIG